MTSPASERAVITVAAAAGGTRLDVFVAEHTGCSRSRAAARIAVGEITVDGLPATKSTRLPPGARVGVSAPRPPVPARPVALPPVRYRDDDVLVVAKPPGLVVHPGSGRPSGTLVDALRDAGVPVAGGAPERPGIVHRLDRDTSGLLVVATSQAAYDGLVAALRRREVHRRYLALAEGVPPARGRVDAPIGRHPRVRTRFAALAEGRPAITHFEVLEVGQAPEPVVGRPAVALLSCRLETGRTHQIRVHLSFAGHPVVGDATYGARPEVARAVGLDRPFLHAVELAFDHPVTGERVHLVDPLPDDLADAALAAGLTSPSASE